MYRIAVIDDEPKILKGLTDLLCRTFSQQAQIVSFQHSAQLLAYSHQNDIDVLVTDISMPDMDGLELGAKIRLQNPFVKIIIISGHSRFEYAKTAISLQVCEYLLKPIDRDRFIEVIGQTLQNLETAKAALGPLPSQLVEDQRHYETMLLRAIRHADPDALEWLKHYGFESCAMELILFEFADDATAEEENRFQMLFRALEPTGYHHLFLQISPIRFLWVCPHEPKRQQLLWDLLDKLRERTTICNIGVSIPILSCNEVCNGYHQALCALKKSLYSSGNYLYSFEGFSTGIFDAEKLSLSILRSFMSMDFAQVDRELASLFARFRQERTPIRQLREVLQTLAQELDTVLSRSGMSKEAYEGIKMRLDMLDRYRSIMEIEQDFNAFFIKIKDTMMVVKNMRLEQNLEKALAYIDSNFAQDLSLEQVAEHASLNASYFSTIFKKHVGSNFVIYLMNQRIEQAKRLLRDPNCKILQIAQASGFRDTRYFAKAFKKNVGITPSEYRNIVLQLNNKLGEPHKD